MLNEINLLLQILRMHTSRRDKQQLTSFTLRQNFRMKIRQEQIEDSKKRLRGNYLQLQKRQLQQQTSQWQSNQNQFLQPNIHKKGFPQYMQYGYQNQHHNILQYQNINNYVNQNQRNSLNHQFNIDFNNFLAHLQCLKRSKFIQPKPQQKCLRVNKASQQEYYPPLCQKLAPNQLNFNQNKTNNLNVSSINKNKKKILLRHKNFIVFDELLGSGSFSKVYLGVDSDRNVQVAIKQLQQIPENQIKVLQNITSPYIIQLLSFWKNQQKGKIYLVFQLCERNLRQQLVRGITQKQKLQYVNHIVMGIDTLFQKNIIHRDLKFQNILISKGYIAKIADFGLAKQLGQLLDVRSLKCGTPYTMAPQIYFHQGKTRFDKPFYSQKCDIWSFGVILHEILYGKHPFDCKIERMHKMQRVLVNKRYGNLDNIIDRALIKSPKDRISWKNLKQIYYQKSICKEVRPMDDYNIKKQHNMNTKMIENHPVKKELTKIRSEKKIKLNNFKDQVQILNELKPQQAVKINKISQLPQNISSQQVKIKAQLEQLIVDGIQQKQVDINAGFQYEHSRYNEIFNRNDFNINMLNKRQKTAPSMLPINAKPIKSKQNKQKPNAIHDSYINLRPHKSKTQNNENCAVYVNQLKQDRSEFLVIDQSTNANQNLYRCKKINNLIVGHNELLKMSTRSKAEMISNIRAYGNSGGGNESQEFIGIQKANLSKTSIQNIIIQLPLFIIFVVVTAMIFINFF